MTEVEGNLDSIVVENGDITADLHGDGSIGLNISVETPEESVELEVNCDDTHVESEKIVNGIKSDSDNDEGGLKEPSKPKSEKLKDGSPEHDASTQRVGGRVRKSSMERLLEETLNTVESYPEDPNSEGFDERKSSYSSQGSVGSADSDCNSGNPSVHKTSIYEQKQIEAPSASRGDIIASRTENLFKNYKRDMSIHEAKPMVNINEEIEIDQLNSKNDQVSKSKIDIVREEKERELLEIRKQYQQRLLDEEREKAGARTKKLEDKLNTGQEYDEDGDVFLERPSTSPSSSRASISSSASVDDDGAPKQRRTSVYEQKQIEAPSSTRGNVIASRTEHLFKQYEKDSAYNVTKPMIDLTEGADVSQVNDDIIECTTEVDDASLERGRELQNVKLQFQQRLAEEEKERAEERARKDAETEVKSRKPLGSHMNRYIALTKGEAFSHSSDEDDEQDGVDNSLYIDKHGVKIERSGGKIEIVKSTDSISSIKNRFGGNTQWKKTDTEAPPVNEVDSTTVSSARNVFKEREVKKQETSSFNRPLSKKVRNPKELMEIRKKATYGSEEELPEDGVVKKSIVIENEELDPSCKHHALNVYKNLEKKEENNLTLQKPTTKLISDVEAQATMEGIRTLSSSTSEASDINETTNDLTVDTVSGYGSAAPCSPSSTLSEDYLSDHKDASPREELKDSSVLHCQESTLNMEVNLDDISLVNCQVEISSADVECDNGVEYVGV